ncbi:MAG: DUF4332 domain-containing protein [Actinomycetota bacterium]
MLTTGLSHTVARSYLTELLGDPALVSRRSTAQMARLYEQAGEALGVVDRHRDEPFTPSTVRYQRVVIERAFDGAARRLVGLTSQRGPGWHPSPRSSSGAFGSGTVLVRLDVNAASEAELAALPGLGSVSARRLVAVRSSTGNFDDLDSARRAARVSPGPWARTAPFVFVGSGEPPPVLTSAAIAIEQRGFGGLIDELRSGRVTVTGSDDEFSLATVIDVAQRLVASIEQRRTHPRHWGPAQARLEYGNQAIRTLERVRRRATQAPCRSAAVTRSAYLDTVEQMIVSATDAIDVVMFYFALPEDTTVPATRLLDAVLNAHSRGVAVRVVLADDLPADYHGASEINAVAAARLAAAGVDVRRGPLDRTVHAKAVRADDVVVAGSHNWTTSSFYRYDDVSIAIEGAAPLDRFTERFDQLWESLAPMPQRRLRAAMLEHLPSFVRALLVEAGVTTIDELVEQGRLIARRRALALAVRTTEPVIDHAVHVGRIMVELGLSEHTAMALVAAGLDSPSKVVGAPLHELENAVASTTALPLPFALRTPPAGLAEWIWGLDT